MKTKLFTIAFLLLVAAFSYGEQQTAPLVYVKDVGDASYTYCKLEGQGGDPWGPPKTGRGLIKTTGSSVTIDATTGSDDPFTELTAGDVIYFFSGNTYYSRRVATVASVDQITVDTAVTLTDVSWTWRKAVCGTGAGDGWLDVSDFKTLNFTVSWITKNATSIDYSLECRAGDASAYFVTDGRVSMTATGVNMYVARDAVFDACRVGLKITADTGANSVSAYLLRQR
jgi:hypothetical protein